MNDKTKECGLEDENTGETLSSIPLVGETNVSHSFASKLKSKQDWDNVAAAGALMDSLEVPFDSLPYTYHEAIERGCRLAELAIERGCKLAVLHLDKPQ